jgi:hypothetical protein
MSFIDRHGVAAFQTAHALLALEQDRFGGGGYDPALYALAGFDEASVDDFQKIADAFQLHACPACAPDENAQGPCTQAREAMAAYSAKISAISAEIEAEEVP